jgi:hypothetical protein
MSRPEYSSPDSPLPPGVLPPELAEFLTDQDYACVTQATDIGTVLVLKIPTPDIHSLRGPVPIWLRQELYQHPAAPVIRMVLSFYDQPEAPLALETFINVDDPQQRADFAALTSQEELPMLFYDEALAHQLTKVMPYVHQEQAAALLATAEQILSGMASDTFNFGQAKEAVMEATRL